jgi:hypothetical protein
VERISTVREALLVELGGNVARLRFINTRLILSIGIDLFTTSLTEAMDPILAKKAFETLNQMGLLLPKKEVRRGK